MRLGVYSDYPYQQIDGEVFAERAFAVFLARLAPRFERFTIIGRLAPPTDKARYPLGEQVEFVALPYYARLSDPLPVLKAMIGSIGRFWKALGEVDCVWLLGPHPVSFLFAALALLRRKEVVLGVRQDLPEYVRNRHPGRRALLLMAWGMELAFRALGRVCAVIAVGPRLASNYQGARRMLELTVSLVEESEVVPPTSIRRRYDAELAVLSVGRLEEEKNPLLLADILARLVEQDPRWRLVVCGEGTLSDQLDERLAELGVRDKAELRGYVPQHGGLDDLYRESQMLLHVSWTEGLPQVLYEAFAAALPVVATDVGGVREASAEAVTLIAPGDADAAAAALIELSVDEALRERRLEAGYALAKASTIEAECRRVGDFFGAR